MLVFVQLDVDAISRQMACGNGSTALPWARATQARTCWPSPRPGWTSSAERPEAPCRAVALMPSRTVARTTPCRMARISVSPDPRQSRDRLTEIEFSYDVTAPQNHDPPSRHFHRRREVTQVTPLTPGLPP